MTETPPFNPFFMFATGIDSAAPVIDGQRIDQMERIGHFERWRDDIDLAKDIGARYLRYGVPIHRAWIEADKYDWSHADAAFGRIREHDMVPIAELCRFGMPDWLGGFENPDFPRQFALFARTFANRYPWIQIYTPISSIFITAYTAARMGFCQEGRRDDQSFVKVLKHLCAASLMAMREILQVRPDAIFVQSERATYYHADSPESLPETERLNTMRFLALDLLYGHRVDSGMYEFLLDNGMTRAEYHFFMEMRMGRHCVLGTDYYPANERRVSPDGCRRPAGETLGYEDLVVQYHQRYRLPVMHTETNCPEGLTTGEAVHWLWKEWANALRIRNNGVPLVGFTWFPLVDQVNWGDTDWAISDPAADTINPVGLFDIDRRRRPAGEAYRLLIREWRHLLPAQSVCLQMPIILPSEYDEPLARNRREMIYRYYAQRDVPLNPFAQ